MTGAHAAGRGAFFILPVRRHAQFGVFMHLFGTDLDLNGFTARPQDHGVDRLVTVRFGVSDIIIEFIRQVTIVRMHYPQRGVAVLQTFSDNTHGAHVKEFIKRQMLFLHFAPDAINMFWSSVDFRLHAFVFHFGAQMSNKLFDVMFAIETALMQQFGDAFVFRRMQVAETVVFQFPLQLPDAQTISERRIDVGTFFRRQHALIFRRLFHFAQMSDSLGQFDDHAAEIIHHRQ